MRRRRREYSVYIMANVARTLYVGITDNLERRVYEHKAKTIPGFTSRYGLNRLVYCEFTNDVAAAIAREKQIKGWLRSKKIALIESMNPEWQDLAGSWELVATDSDPRSAQDDMVGGQSFTMSEP